MKFKLIRLTDNSQIPIEVGEAGIHLGRGALLSIDATNISRKQVFISCINGSLSLTCLHRSPVTILSGGIEKVISMNDKVSLQHGDIIQFSPDEFHFGVELPATSDHSEEKKRKTRKLPEWMTNGNAKASTNKPQRQMKANSSIDKENESPQVNKAGPGKMKNVAKVKSPGNKDGDSKTESSPQKPTKRSEEDEKVENTNNTSTEEKTASKAGKEEDAASSVIAEAAGTSSSTAVQYKTVITPADFQDSDDEEVNNGAMAKTKPKAASRPSCQYGAACYRKNPTHRQRESHPGDSDYKQPEDNRPECEYGTNCYRKNPAHKKNFKHTQKPQPKRAAKQKAGKPKKDEDEYESDFIDDDEQDVSFDDTDEDANWNPDDDTDDD